MAVDVRDITPKNQIKTVYYAISEDFVFGMFNSCKNVQDPSSGKAALSMLCGMEASQCTPEKWLRYLGEKSLNPDFIPFNIYFNISSNSTMSLDILNLTLHPKNATFEPCTGRCSCQDCSTSCQPIEPTVLPNAFTILGFDPLEFVMACTFLAFLISFGTALICSYFYGKKRLGTVVYSLNADYESPIGADADAESASQEPHCYDRLGARMEGLFERFFCSWGYFCARRPVVVISCAVIFCIVLSLGIIFFKVTTDPVELWSAADSQARQEKNYFDNNFA